MYVFSVAQKQKLVPSGTWVDCRVLVLQHYIYVAQFIDLSMRMYPDSTKMKHSKMEM